MGRSKFPGKPSKHVNKKRVNVLLCTSVMSTVQKSSVKNLFNDSQNITLSEYNKQQITESQDAVTDENTVCPAVNQLQTDEFESLGILFSTKKSSAFLYNYTNLTFKNDNLAVSKVKAMKNSKRLMKKPAELNIALKVVKNDPTASSNNKKRLYVEKNQGNTSPLIGKFVLPSRSLHSSRVIIPNKRFINNYPTNKKGGECYANNLKTKLNTEHHPVVKRKKILLKNEYKTTNIKICEVNDEKLDESSDLMLIDADNVSARTTHCKLVLRKARLQLHTQASEAHSIDSGPFSTCTTTTNNLPGTVTCGVCGAVRFYRFVKQARKFNIYSCESCRKFISKMIKRQTCSKTCALPMLECHKGQGMCHVPPIVRSQQWKLIRCAYKARCPACWLKMCLRSFQMPPHLKTSLIRMLPENMRCIDANVPAVETNRPQTKSITPQYLRNQEIKTTLREKAQLYLSSVLSNTDKKDMNHKKDLNQASSAISNNSPESTKRHKLELKGPRVKHVCRSASIVLGQPIATFAQETNNEEKTSSSSNNSIDLETTDLQIEESPSDLDLNCKTTTSVPNTTTCTTEDVTSSIVSTDEVISPLNPELNEPKIPPEPYITISSEMLECSNTKQENSNGLGLIGSEPFSVQAVCLNCGSSGREQLIYCSCCCDPYHFYCINDSSIFQYIILKIATSKNSSLKTDIWTCSRCLMSQCQDSVICQICNRSYYDTQNNENELDESDRSMVLKCTECKKLIDIKHEELSDELYQVLNYSPCSNLFICNNCSIKTGKLSNWREIIDSALNNCYHIVLKILSNNAKVKQIMENHSFVCKSVCVSNFEMNPDPTFDELENKDKKKILCNNYEYLPTISLLQIKKNINLNKYKSIHEFHCDCELVFKQNNCNYLSHSFCSILKQIFPWYKILNVEDVELNMTLVRNNFLKQNHICWRGPDYARIPELHEYVCDNTDKTLTDSRVCILCKVSGDGLNALEGRLLYCGLNNWVHINCAFWSSDIYEEIDCSLKNMYQVIAYSHTRYCNICKKNGASIRCSVISCDTTYHYTCARNENFVFLHNKTIFCSTHSSHCATTNILNEQDFQIQRPIFIQIDLKKIHIELSKVQYVIGSLNITSLGRVFPQISDTEEAIIPADFVCSRLFWSTIKPWTIVKYTITTSVNLKKLETFNNEKNFTVDHSLSCNEIDKRINEIQTWHNGADKDEINNVDETIVSQIIDYILETICTKEAVEDDEPQNTTDLLPPDLKDAIFEDLPHDLLDGISMQDIFPKLMSYEDVLAMDTVKNCDTKSITDTDKYTLRKPNDFLESKPDYVQSTKISSSGDQKLKQSNTGIFPRIKKVRSRNHHSLTFSCKFDNNNTTTKIKKRKLSKSVTDISSNLYMVLDSDTESTVRELKYCLEENSIASDRYKTETSQTNEPGKENKFRIWQNRTQSRILQVDGASSDTDSVCELETKRIRTTRRDIESIMNSPTNNLVLNANSKQLFRLRMLQVDGPDDNDFDFQEKIKKLKSLSNLLNQNTSSQFLQIDGTNDSNLCESNCLFEEQVIKKNESPVKCDRCECTYRTLSSYNRHLSTCDYMTSDSDSDNTQQITDRSDENSTSLHFVEENKNSQKPETPVHVINMPQPTTNTVVELKKQVFQQVLQPPQLIPTKKIIVDPSSACKIPTDSLKVSIPIQHQKIKKPIVQKPRAIIKRSRPTLQKRTIKSQSVNQYTVTPQVTEANNQRPTIIIQHLSSPNLMPAYIEAFQHQTGQNLQYIATIVPNETKPPPPYILPNTNLVAGGYLPTTEPTNFINLQNGIQGFTQPPVMGTLIQQQQQQIRPTTTIQCGMMSSEQLLLSSVPTNMNTMVTDLSGSMYYTSEPVYYGYETIVQNTVMSSQQFVSTLPGVLEANSSYSTTTQVFQTSKIEPVAMNNGGYIIVDPSTVPQITQPPLLVNTLQAPVLTQNKSLTTFQQTSIPNANFPTLCNIPTVEPIIYTEKPISIKQPTPPPIKPQILYNNTNFSSTETNKKTILPINNEDMPPLNVTTHHKPVLPKPKVSSPPLEIQKCEVKPQPEYTLTKVLPETSNLIKERPISELKLKPKPNKPAKESTKRLNTTSSEDDKVKLVKLESKSLKLIFKKQSTDGTYKINNKLNFTTKNTEQVTPLAQSKTQTVESMMNVKNNIRKTTKIVEKNKDKETASDNILYNIHSQDGFDFSSTSITELWRKVFEAVQLARAAYNMPPLSENAFNKINGLQLLGLNSNGLRLLVEQIPGVEKCIKYKPLGSKKHAKEFNNQTEKETCTAARCRSYTFTKQPYDMFKWLTSKHRNPDFALQGDSESVSKRQSSVNLPMATRFRQLKETSKNAVGVYRSNIHGRGLFCLRDIECGEMVIEYAGEVIRSTLTDKREKHYNSKEIGCYMFRVDDNFVIDATMKGNAARFINHSCDPNCYSRVLDILGHKHILIFALRKILHGEELTYDYKFPFEEDKIPCTCGSKKCRKYLN